MFTPITLYSENLQSSEVLSNKVPKLRDSDIHIWSVNRTIYENQKAYSDYFLDENEQSRAQKFRFKKDHDLFVTGRYLTKILLAYYSNCSPGSVKLIADTCGKPTCNLNLFFNISHSGNRLFLGFSNSQIGVDIEKEDPKIDVYTVGKGNFSELEFKLLLDTSEDQKLATFFEIWTKKESLIKGIGKGLSLSLIDFNVMAMDGKVDWHHQPKNPFGQWYVRKINSAAGYSSAFATQQFTSCVNHFSVEI